MILLNLYIVKSQSRKPAMLLQFALSKFKIIHSQARSEVFRGALKLVKEGSDDILGLICLELRPEESRIEVSLLSVSIENMGKEKQYDRIAGCLLAYACREALRLYAENACVSLRPKTKLRSHYKKQYNMLDAGLSLALLNGALLDLIMEYTSL